MYLNKNHARISFVLLFVVGGALILWYGIVHPIIAKLYIEPKCYEGTHYVQNNKYTEFDGGKDFAEVLQECGMLELGEVVEFFYFDNRRSDNPFYGKRCDVFALSVNIQDDAKYYEKKELLIENVSEPKYSGTFSYYYTSEIDMPGVVFAFQDSTRTIRLVYVTNAQPYDPLLPAIAQNSPLFSYDDP